MLQMLKYIRIFREISIRDVDLACILIIEKILHRLRVHLESKNITVVPNLKLGFSL